MQIAIGALILATLGLILEKSPINPRYKQKLVRGVLVFGLIILITMAMDAAGILSN